MNNLIVYGAGNVGKMFCEYIANGMSNDYENIYLFDNDKTKQTKTLYGYYVLTEDEFNAQLNLDNVQIIIAMDKWHEVYDDLNKKNKADKILTIYTNLDFVYGKYRPKYTSYDNDKSVQYIARLTELQNNGIDKFLSGRPLFECINRVAIMLSNLCNYACLHKACPANGVRTKEIMPGSVVYKIFDELSDNNFEGEVCFHLYNEPLIDPRLFNFIHYSKEKMPNVNIHIYSNGYYLNNTMVKELEDAGVTRITTTAYGDDEWKRLTALDVSVAFHVLYGNLDQRLDLYNYREGTSCSRRCISFFEQIPIYVNGDIGTCCLDWKHTYNLGNIYNHSLKEIVNSEEIREFQLGLLNGDRSRFAICRNCEWY